MTVPAVQEVTDVHGVKRAMATISQALMADSVSRWLAAPGSEDAFHHAVMRSYLQSGQRQRFFHADDFSGCALVGDVDPQAAAQQQTAAQQDGQQQGGAQGGAEEDEVVRHARADRHAALGRLGSQPHLERLAQEHGGALCVHFVGVHPQRQGRGLGGALLRHVCALADAAAKHLYLEASTPRSAALYARHGFAGVADKPLGEPGEEGAPVLRVMVRPPSGVAVSTSA